MKVYHLLGIRHPAVIFAKTPEEAIAQAIEQGLVGDWEAPEAVEVPLPKGYRIIYDPLVGSMEQAELPLSVDEPEPDKPHTITRSGVKVYDDWRDNIVVDAEAPAVVWKAGHSTFGTHTSVPGQPYLASENSEDALSWNLFRTLEKAGHLDVVTRALGLEDDFRVLYWYRPWDVAEPLPEIGEALNRVEQWGKIGGRFQTETDIILKGQRYLIYEQAHAQVHKGLVLAREIGYPHETGFALLVLGDIALAEGAYAEAHQLSQESVIICQEIGQQVELAGALATLGIAARGLDDLRQARQHLYQALRMAAHLSCQIIRLSFHSQDGLQVFVRDAAGALNGAASPEYPG